MQRISLLKLYLIFLKIGAILLGGGYVILPIITSELSEKHHLIDEEELVDYFALSQSLPGVIAANMSMFAGYKIRGKLGAVAAMFGIVTVPFLCIVFLASLLGKITDNIYVKSILAGVGVAVIALITLTVREMWQKSKIDIFFLFIFISALISLFVFGFTPVQTIICFIFVGIICKHLTKKEAKS